MKSKMDLRREAAELAKEVDTLNAELRARTDEYRKAQQDPNSTIEELNRLEGALRATSQIHHQLQEAREALDKLLLELSTESDPRYGGSAPPFKEPGWLHEQLWRFSNWFRSLWAGQ